MTSNQPTVTDAQAWRPEALATLADAWENTARAVHSQVQAAWRAVRDGHRTWAGGAGVAGRTEAAAFTESGESVARALVLAAAAARDGAQQIGAARQQLADCVQAAREAGFLVGDDGAVHPGSSPTPMLVLLAGSDAGVADQFLATRAAEWSRQIIAAMSELRDADDDAAADIRDAFDAVGRRVDTGLGNVDGIAWDVRIEANRTRIAQAIVNHLDDHQADDRAIFYRGLLGEIDDPAGSGRRVDRQILGFDPDRASLIELNGSLDTASSVVVMVPGMNTTIEGSAAGTTSARQFVRATRGGVAAITYLGGRFPGGDHIAEALLEAASPRAALDMAPRLVSFSRDVDATVDATGRAIPVTYVGHSYGGAILGTAEALGLTADRTLYVAAAGAGFGVNDLGDWHNRNPDVLRFSMTAPADPIALVQGIPGGAHGADPDRMPGVIHLATGHYGDGRLMAGPDAHTDVISAVESDAWRNVLAVITGDREHIRLAG